MAVRIEDAGFEIRDQIMWVYGGGFPKSMDISKQIDKRAGIERGVVGSKLGQPGYSLADNGHINAIYGNFHNPTAECSITKPATDEAKEWEGWGTALKPAHEPIVMARKPLSEKTVVDNVLKYGTGGINIDDSRIGTDDNLGGGATKGSVLSVDGFDRPWMHDEEKMKEFGDKMKEKVEHEQTLGRFPANIIFDEEAGKILDEQSGISRSGVVKNDKGAYDGTSNTGFLRGVSNKSNQHGDIGGASRFFYCPKTSKTDRNEGLDEFEEKQTVGGVGGIGDYKDDVNSASGKFGSEKTPSKNFHPTVKPTDLMLYLIRLVTPKGGTTLDPFMGSGSTGKAAVRGGFDFVGIEREEDYMEIAEARIQYEIDNPYNEETGKRTEIKKETKETLNKFFG